MYIKEYCLSEDLLDIEKEYGISKKEYYAFLYSQRFYFSNPKYRQDKLKKKKKRQNLPMIEMDYESEN